MPIPKSWLSPGPRTDEHAQCLFKLFKRRPSSHPKLETRLNEHPDISIWRDLRRGVHVDARSRFQKTALFYAATRGNSTVVQLLLEHNADPNGKDYPITPLAIAAGRGDMETVRNLLAKGADMAAGNWHPLFAAVEEDHDEVVKLLLMRGADPNVTTNDGPTPMFYASCNGSEAIVMLLLADGAKATTKYFVPEPSPSTPLDCAIKNGHTSVVELLRRNSEDTR